MDVDRRRQIVRLYHEARARAEQERHAFLDVACDGDEELRREVDSLLADDARAAPLGEGSGRVIAADLTGAHTGVSGRGAPVTGQMLGGYRIERLLGSGGMGSVFLARDTTLHRHVALKIIHESHDGDDARGRLLREARSAAALSHPHICTILEIGEADGSAFIVMEYVEGRCLRDRLDEGRVPLDEAVRYGIQAAQALAYAHDHGVIHRDFKAANVIVGAAGVLKIVDFGLARRHDPLIAAGTTMASLLPPGTFAGTPYAMAPEQVRGEATDARTDVWALGVLLHETASGTKPFEATTTPELFSAILRDAPAPLPGDVPVALRQIIARCLEKAPQRRYQHASEVGAALEALSSSVVATRATWRRRLARPRWLRAAAGLVIAVPLAMRALPFVREWLVPSSLQNEPVTLAVLPLENLTRDPDQEHFSDGLTDRLTTVLGRLRSSRLSVIGRGSSIPYKQSTKPLSQIGRELHANAALKGSVRRSADQVQILAELVETSNGQTIWSAAYDRSVSDLLTIEHEIAQAVSGALRISADGADGGPPSTRKLNPQAYDLYLRGLSHTMRDNERDVDQAIALFERAVALDPTFVPAQAYLALAYGAKSSAYPPDDPLWEEKGFAAAQRALDLDPDAPEALYAQALLLWRPSHGFPSREALLALRRALAVQPNFDAAWHMHGAILMHVGHVEAGTRDIERALAINPRNTAARIRFAPIYVFQQKFDEAIAALNQVPAEASTSQWTFYMPWALMSLGRLDEAGRVIERALEDNPADQGGLLHAARAMLRARRGDRSGAAADVADAIQIGRSFFHFHHTAYAIGAVYATLGDVDEAQRWIERAAADGFPNYTYFERDVHLARLRATPRFRQFVAKLRQEWQHIPGEPD
jgi:serine/threonine-protein kinase